MKLYPVSTSRRIRIITALICIILQANAYSQDTIISYPSSLEVYCPVYYSFDRLPLVVVPMMISRVRTSLTALGVSYSRNINSKVSISPCLEFFDFYNDAYLINKKVSNEPTDHGSVLSRTHFLTKLDIVHSLMQFKSFVISIQGGVFMRIGSETIQASPYNPNHLDVVAVIRPYLDPGVNLGLKADYSLSPKWSVSASLRYDQIIWRKGNGPIDLNPNLPGTSKRFCTLTYGLIYRWGKP